MKRLFLLPALMLGLSFACDQPYEEVAGIKIGCPLEDNGDFKEMVVIEATNSTLYQKERTGIFNVIYVTTIDGIVESAIFGVNNGAAVDKEIAQDLFLSLENRWGKFEKLSESEYTVIPNSAVLGRIDYTYVPGEVVLVYDSKILLKRKNDVLKEKQERLDKEISQF